MTLLHGLSLFALLASAVTRSAVTRSAVTRSARPSVHAALVAPPSPTRQRPSRSDSARDTTRVVRDTGRAAAPGRDTAVSRAPAAGLPARPTGLAGWIVLVALAGAGSSIGLAVWASSSSSTSPSTDNVLAWSSVALVAAFLLVAGFWWGERRALGGYEQWDAARSTIIAKGLAARDSAGMRSAALGTAARTGEQRPWVGLPEIVMIGLALCALAFLLLFVAESKSGGTLVESHWGGFGGGMGGWRISPALLYLATAIAFGGMLTIVAAEQMKPPTSPTPVKASADTAAKAPADTSAKSSAGPRPVPTSPR